MHHVRTFPFVNDKHNIIEALGHQVSLASLSQTPCLSPVSLVHTIDRSWRWSQALMLMYAITLIIRGRADNDAIWLDEWFPKEGYGKPTHNIRVVL